MKQGRLNGFLAYEDNKPVGWCNADDIQRYSRIMDDQRIPKTSDAKVGAIVCFVVDHQLRSKGIATALLKAAYRYFREMGYDSVEAYPKISPDSAFI